MKKKPKEGGAKTGLFRRLKYSLRKNLREIIEIDFLEMGVLEFKRDMTRKIDIEELERAGLPVPERYRRIVRKRSDPLSVLIHSYIEHCAGKLEQVSLDGCWKYVLRDIDMDEIDGKISFQQYNGEWKKVNRKHLSGRLRSAYKKSLKS